MKNGQSQGCARVHVCVCVSKMNHVTMNDYVSTDVTCV